MGGGGPWEELFVGKWMLPKHSWDVFLVQSISREIQDVPSEHLVIHLERSDGAKVEVVFDKMSIDGNMYTAGTKKKAIVIGFQRKANDLVRKIARAVQC